MTKNMGTVDRIFRATLAVVVALLYVLGEISGTAAVVLGIMAVVFLATSAMGYCPLYTVAGVKTRRAKV